MKQVLVSMRSRQNREPEPELSSGREVERRPREIGRTADGEQNQLRPKPTVFVSAHKLHITNSNIHMSTKWLPATSPVYLSMDRWSLF